MDTKHISSFDLKISAYLKNLSKVMSSNLALVACSQRSNAEGKVILWWFRMVLWYWNKTEIFWSRLTKGFNYPTYL